VLLWRRSERERFLHEEWPALQARLARLGLDLKDLLRAPRHEEGK
jgi:GntR family transcriptional regulator